VLVHHATTNIRNLHFLAEACSACEVVLVLYNGLAEFFTACETAKVKRYAPSVFMNIGSEVTAAVSLVSSALEDS
jgi:hypothetical protein